MRNAPFKNAILRALCILFVISFALAQPFKGPPDADPEMMERLRTIMKWRLLEDLEMNDKQTDQFMPAFSKWEKSNIELDEQLNEKFSAVKEMLKSEKKDDEKLSVLISEYIELKTQKSETELQLYWDTKDFLNPVQQVKLLTFPDRFREDMRGLLHKFHDGRGPRNMQDEQNPKEKK